MIDPRKWLTVRPEGLYCSAGDFFVDPMRPVPTAVITHGHADHARAGHGRVLATAETLAIMRSRFGEECWERSQAVAFGEEIAIGEATVSLAPAGHVLGSAQAVLTHGGARVVISGDYKRRADPTCTSFEPVAGDVFVTEATFALPVFRHPDDRDEIAKLLHSVETFPNRAHLVGAYALGKAQRVIRLLRDQGYDRPIYCHGALDALCDLYTAHGVDLGTLVPVTAANKKALAGEIIVCPPGQLNDRWARAFPDAVTAMASGWMRVRQRARQRNVELPLILSDHADWDELTDTLHDVGAPEVWITHGREEALAHYAQSKGFRAEALSLVGFEEGEDG